MHLKKITGGESSGAQGGRGELGDRQKFDMLRQGSRLNITRKERSPNSCNLQLLDFAKVGMTKYHKLGDWVA